VRDCGLLLERVERRMACTRGHSFDITRSGYINLLQPQDRRSLAAGDSREAVAARARLLGAGVGQQIVAAFAELAASYLADQAVVADLGSGTGDLLAALHALRAIDGVGIDLSAAAIDHAARRFPDHTWVVANADRRLPLLDRSVDLVLSLHGRRNAADTERVLTRGGHLIVGIPAHDDLIELRTSVLGSGVDRDRGEALISELASSFSIITRASAREQHHLDRASLVDLLHGTYRGIRTSSAARVEALTELDVTLASEFLVFAPKP
jgi:23S rRNA (guanine745-N1)-methyltransferase